LKRHRCTIPGPAVCTLLPLIRRAVTRGLRDEPGRP
jgi:hypothetical protein